MISEIAVGVRVCGNSTVETQGITPRRICAIRFSVCVLATNAYHVVGCCIIFYDWNNIYGDQH